jgi:hypothetical protein
LGFDKSLLPYQEHEDHEPIPFGFGSFFSYFLLKALDEDVHHVNALPRLGDVHATFGILF